MYQIGLTVCWWCARFIFVTCPERHNINGGRKKGDWLQFSWKSMRSGTVMQGRHMTLVQRPWWCCTWSYQLFLSWLLRQRRITFCSCPQPLSLLSAHLLARLNMVLVTVTHSTSQAKASVAFLCASMESLFDHGVDVLVVCSESVLTCCIFAVFIQVLLFVRLSRSEIKSNIILSGILPPCLFFLLGCSWYWQGCQKRRLWC